MSFRHLKDLILYSSSRNRDVHFNYNLIILISYDELSQNPVNEIKCFFNPSVLFPKNRVLADLAI